MRRAAIALLVGLVACGPSTSRTAEELIPVAPTSEAEPRPSPDESTATTATPAEPTLEEALKAIGAWCQLPLSVQSDCRWRGVTVYVEVPSDWRQSSELREQACDNGYINAAYLIATDGATWFAAADYNSDTRALAKALQRAGLHVELRSYCD